MKLNVLDIIACPSCKGFPLVLRTLSEGNIASTNTKDVEMCKYYCGYIQKPVNEAKEEINKNYCTKCNCKTIEEGILHCAECDSYYLIRNGIPELIADDLKSAEEIALLVRV